MLQSVGCDLVVGSGLTVDRCGRCGGAGECGVGAQYEWVERPASPCSATCGPGTRSVQVFT